jgi:hypothetical protein
MSKQSVITQEMLFCGIDVSAKSLTVAVQQENQSIEQRAFANGASGHKSLKPCWPGARLDYKFRFESCSTLSKGYCEATHHTMARSFFRHWFRHNSWPSRDLSVRSNQIVNVNANTVLESEDISRFCGPRANGATIMFNAGVDWLIQHEGAVLLPRLLGNKSNETCLRSFSS